MRWLAAFALVLVLATAVWAGQVVVGNFTAGDLAGWEQEEFNGTTSYELVTDRCCTVLSAMSCGTASALVKKVAVDPKQYPVISWAWKVEDLIVKGKELEKSGDDFAARVYVVFPGKWFWQTRSICYVWANRLPQGWVWDNPYAGHKVVMIAVEAGSENLGKWRSYQRNYVDDFRRAYGEDPPQLGAVAVMTDSDDTDSEALAFYGDIVLVSAPPAEH